MPKRLIVKRNVGKTYLDKLKSSFSRDPALAE